MKLLGTDKLPAGAQVAPRTGAWIETWWGELNDLNNSRRPPHGGVD